jgi:alanine dehydrogenase
MELEMGFETLLFSKEDIRNCLDMHTCLNIVEKIYEEHGKGSAIMPPKLHLEISRERGWVNAMPAYLPDHDAAGLKWAGGWGKNRERFLPYIMAEIFLIDPKTGLLNAVMEGGYITELRTGAATGVAAKYLAKKNSQAAAIIGAGAQGRMQLRALRHVFNLKEVRISDISQKAAQDFATEMQEELGISITIALHPQEAVSNADIIITATNANEILIRQEWVAPGTFIATLGSYTELDPKIILNAGKIIVDNWEQNKHRGDLAPLVEKGLITKDHIYGEIGEIVAGLKPGRENGDETIVACLIGLGSLDIACANFVYNESHKRKMGGVFDFQQKS